MKKLLVCVFVIINALMFGQQQYQSSDNMLSTYKKNRSDGYSWRDRESNYDKTKKVVSSDKLLSTIWVTDPLASSQIILVFYKDNVFNIGTRQAGILITGKYKINDQKLILFDYSSNDSNLDGTGLSNERSVCSFFSNVNHLIYQDYITVNDVKYYAIGSEYSNGTEIDFNGVPVIVESDIKVMNENMRFRDAPSRDGKPIRIYQYGEITTKEVTSLKKGTIVFLLARTKKTETIDEVSSSWYYIKLYDGYEWYQYGWVFGGYFGDYDKAKEDEYWTIVCMELEK